MDALMPLASLPTKISGRNRAWRKLCIDAIRNDPTWNNGEYTTQPPALRTVAGMLFLMGNNPVQRQKDAPTLQLADKVFEAAVTNSAARLDANDAMYALRASEDYDPAPRLGEIRAPLLAINFADDLINPPELRILEREIKRVKHGRAILYPLTDKTRGHGTHTLAAIWKKDLAQLLRKQAKANPP
jgi:homoserine O-acetyltransferase